MADYQSMRPTERAKLQLQIGKHMAYEAQIANNDDSFRHPVGVTLGSIVYALEEMATGMRATYILLDQVNSRLKQLERSGRP